MKRESTRKKILLLHFSRLGDMIQSLPAVRRLKESDPGCHITFLGIEDFCTLLKGVPFIDRLVTIPATSLRDLKASEHVVDKASMDRFYDLVPPLSESYDLFVNMTHTAASGYLSERIAADVKSGRVFSKDGEIPVRGNWGKYLFALAKHGTANALNLVDIYMGMAGVPNRPTEQYLPGDDAGDRLCASKLDASGYDPARPAIGFQLGASHASRMWPIEHFVSLGQSLRDRLNAQILLFGSPGERHLAERFQALALYPVMDLIGKLSLEELPSFLKMTDLLVSNDTGPMHIAAAVGVKIVGIFSSSANFRLTGPYGSGHVALQADLPCAPCLPTTVCAQPLCSRAISPGDVLQGVFLALGRGGGQAPSHPPAAGLYRSYFHADGTCRYEPVGGERPGFAPWLASRHDLHVALHQSLWDGYLGLNGTQGAAGGADRPPAGPAGMETGLLEALGAACREFRAIYGRAQAACRRIIAEFGKRSPRTQSIMEQVRILEGIEQELLALENPLPMIKDLHEFYAAEVETCQFPKLAHELQRRYRLIDALLENFEAQLKQRVRRDAPVAAPSRSLHAKQ